VPYEEPAETRKLERARSPTRYFYSLKISFCK
jgi:hypothetical protein